jgi:colanic acid biosynthesis glycosyl transferase WcaI
VKILFLNQYGPPDAPPTAKLLGDLADFLRSRGHEIAIITAARKYEQRAHEGRARGENELRALLLVLWRGLRAPHPDLVISFSSPPCLVLAAALVARRHRARSIHWALDLYPDLAVALGVLPAGPLARLLQRIVRWSYHHTDLVITLDTDMKAHLRHRYEVEAAILPPWPPESRTAAVASVPLDDPWSWLYSGNLGRAHEWKTLLDVQAEIEKRGSPIRLIIQGGGQAWPQAQQYAARLGLKNIFWRDYADENNLMNTLSAAGALVITQKPETRGMLWPSKLALGQLAGKSILWIGPIDGSTAHTLQSVGKPTHGVFAPGEITPIADWLEKTRGPSSGERSTPGIEPGLITQLRTESLNRWREWVDG